ncbi:MAG: Flp family type IVb pilin [Gammaproteobacteria bacterium]
MAKMIKRISIRLIKDESGAGMTEYALLLAMIGILLIATLVALASGINTVLNVATTALGGTAALAPANPLAP